jgi:hypothetical protein
MTAIIMFKELVKRLDNLNDHPSHDHGESGQGEGRLPVVPEPGAAALHLGPEIQR